MCLKKKVFTFFLNRDLLVNLHLIVNSVGFVLTLLIKKY